MAQPRRPRLIVPAAGMGSRFAAAGFEAPKPFVDVHGSPMIAVVLRTLRDVLGPLRAAVAIQRSHKKWLDGVRVDDVDYAFLDGHTEGAAVTVRMILDAAGVDDDEPVVVANSDQVTAFDGGRFTAATTTSSGAILTFQCPERDPKWSYVETGSDGRVSRTVEKVPVSDSATVGVYGFRSAGTLRRAIDAMTLAGDRTNGELYLCPCFNHLPADEVSTYGRPEAVPADRLWGLGTPEDLARSLSDAELMAWLSR